MLLERAIDRYLLTLESAGYSQHTLRAYSTRLGDFARSLGEDPPLIQTSESIQQYLASLRTRRFGRKVGVSSTTLSHAFAILSGFYRFAERQLGVEPNPMRDVIRARPDTSVDSDYQALTSDELETLLHCARHGWADTDQPDHRTEQRRIEDALLVSLMALAGLRVSEVCGLDVVDIDGDTAHVLGKGRKQRNVPLDADIMELLALHTPPGDGAPHLFGMPRNPARRLAPASLQERIPRLARRAGIIQPRVTPHVLRHTFGSLMLAADPTALVPTRDLMGHESVETTNKYAHTREEARRLALASMSEMRRRSRR